MTLEELQTLVESKLQRKAVVNVGPTPLALLGVAFVVLKLMGYITWSWWWVLAPFWVPICLVLGIILIGIVVLIIPIILKSKQKKDDSTATVNTDDNNNSNCQKEESVETKAPVKKPTKKKKSNGTTEKNK